jgi:hypothetical protein
MLIKKKKMNLMMALVTLFCHKMAINTTACNSMVIMLEMLPCPSISQINGRPGVFQLCTMDPVTQMVGPEKIKILPEITMVSLLQSGPGHWINLRKLLKLLKRRELPKRSLKLKKLPRLRPPPPRD